MKTDEERNLRAQVLAFVSMNTAVTYHDIAVHAGVSPLARERWAMLFRIMVDGALRSTWANGYSLCEGYEWFGVPTAVRLKITMPWRGRASGCFARHTAGFACGRAAGHTGRHVAGGRIVLAVWLPGGKYDPAAAFTDAERRALDIDAANAF